MGDEVPEGWTREFSRSQQREYFYHQGTGRSVWDLKDVTEESKVEGGDKAAKRPREEAAGNASEEDVKRRKRGRRVVVIVPFRDLHEKQQRGAHLKQFVPHMTKFLGDIPGVESFHVLVVEQSNDGRKFNRGKLLNIGFKYAIEMKEKEFDSFVFHDVDLLPQPPLAEWYARYPDSPIHIARAWGRYNSSSTYFGGIVAFSKSDFEAIDGFPTTYWGWGGEDDELSIRVRQHKDMRIIGPPKDLPNAVQDLEEMDLKTKLAFLKKTDWKCQVKWEVRDEYNKYRKMKEKIAWWGLKGTSYKLLETKSLGEHASKITVDVMYNYDNDGREHWANRVQQK